MFASSRLSRAVVGAFVVLGLVLVVSGAGGLRTAGATGSCGFADPCTGVELTGLAGYVNVMTPPGVTPKPPPYPYEIYPQSSTEYYMLGGRWMNASTYDFHVTGISGFTPGWGETNDLTVWRQDAMTASAVVPWGTPEFEECLALETCGLFFHPVSSGSVTVSDGDTLVYFSTTITEQVDVKPGQEYLVGTRNQWGVGQSETAFGSVPNVSMEQSFEGGAYTPLGEAAVVASAGVPTAGGFTWVFAPNGFLGIDPATTTTTTSGATSTTAAATMGTAVLHPPPPVPTSVPSVAPAGSCDSIFCSLDWLFEVFSAFADALFELAQALINLGQVLGDAIAALGGAIADAIGSLLSTLFIPSAGAWDGLMDPIVNSEFLSSMTTLATLPPTLITAAQGSLSAGCGTDATFMGHPIGACTLISAGAAAGDWSIARMMTVAGIGYLSVLALYKRLTDRFES